MASPAVDIITAVTTAVVAIIGATAALLPLLRKVHAEVQEVHHMVNQKSTDDKAYQEDLVQALSRAGIEIPKDQSLKTE
jgi:hypothetical protein